MAALAELDPDLGVTGEDQLSSFLDLFNDEDFSLVLEQQPPPVLQPAHSGAQALVPAGSGSKRSRSSEDACLAQASFAVAQYLPAFQAGGWQQIGPDHSWLCQAAPSPTGGRTTIQSTIDGLLKQLEQHKSAVFPPPVLPSFAPPQVGLAADCCCREQAAESAMPRRLPTSANTCRFQAWLASLLGARWCVWPSLMGPAWQAANVAGL